MKTYVLRTATDIDALAVVEQPEPKPGRGQVLVRTKACSLNYRDLMIATGQYGRGSPPPNVVPLSDGAGEVVAVGADVTRFKVGDRVASCFFRRWYGGE